MCTHIRIHILNLYVCLCSQVSPVPYEPYLYTEKSSTEKARPLVLRWSSKMRATSATICDNPINIHGVVRKYGANVVCGLPPHRSLMLHCEIHFISYSLGTFNVVLNVGSNFSDILKRARLEKGLMS